MVFVVWGFVSVSMGVLNNASWDNDLMVGIVRLAPHLRQVQHAHITSKALFFKILTYGIHFISGGHELMS